MDWALPKLLAGPAALAVMTMVFLLHYLNRRQEHLKWWSLAWACYLARYLILLLAPDYQGLSPAFFIYASLVVPGSWLLYRGSAAFTGRPSRTWVAILLALTWAWVPAGLALGVPRWAATLPCAETVAFTYLLSGWLVLRDRKNELWCRVVAGTPFMIWGLLQSTFPLVGGTAPGITWGFLIAAVCEVWAATGLLMLFIHANLRELSLTRQALEAGERKLAQAFKVSPAAMFVSTLDQGRLLEVSDSAEQLTGYSKEEMIGRTTRELGLWDDPSKRDQLIAKLLEEGSIREFEWTMRQRSGRMLTCLVSAELTRMDQERCVTLALMDITTLKKAEREMAQRLLYEEALAAAAQSLLTNWEGEEDALDLALPHLRAAARAHAVYVYRNSSDLPPEQTATATHRHPAPEDGPGGNPPPPRQVAYGPGGLERWHRLLSGGWPVIAQEPAPARVERELMRSRRIHSLLALPLMCGGRWYGFLKFDRTREQGPWREDEIQRLDTARVMVEAYLERRRVEGALREARDQLEKRVQVRTAALERTNQLLTTEVLERHRAQGALLEYQSRLRSLAAELSLAEERERRLVATELHDEIGQKLAVAQIKLEELESASAGWTGAQLLAETRFLIEQTISITRSLTSRLSSPILYELGFSAAVEWLAEKLEADHGIAVRMDIQEAEIRLGEDLMVVLYRAVSELLHNVVKHARASRVEVSLRASGPELLISVSDNGAGFEAGGLWDRSGRKAGFGLFSIRERLGYLGGGFQVISRPGQGTKVLLSAPLAEQTTVREEALP